MSALTWEDPPPSSRRRGANYELDNIANELAAHPGRWAIVATERHRATASTKTANYKRAVAFRPQTAFEFVCRSVDGQHRVYGRYIGCGTESVT